MQAEGQHRITMLVARDGNGKVVVDTFFELLQRGEPMHGREIDLRLMDRIWMGRGSKLRDGHDRPPFRRLDKGQYRSRPDAG